VHTFVFRCDFVVGLAKSKQRCKFEVTAETLKFMPERRPIHQLLIFTSRRSHAAIAPSCDRIRFLSVRAFDTRVLCDEKKEHTAQMLISYERVITLVFNRGWWAMSPSI